MGGSAPELGLGAVGFCPEDKGTETATEGVAGIDVIGFAGVAGGWVHTPLGVQT